MSTSVDQINQDDLKISMEDAAKSLRKDRAVLDVMIRTIGGGIESVGRMETNWRERRTRALVGAAGTAGAAIGATSVPVGNAEDFHVDEIIMHPASGDIFIVDEAAGGTAVAGEVKVRGKSGTGGITSAITAGDILQIGPHTQYEGGTVPAPFSNVSVTKKTYVFQGDATISVTDIMDAEQHYGESELSEQRKDKDAEQLQRMCMAFYGSVGSRETESANGARRHTPTGLNEYLATQTTDMSGQTITLATIGEILRLTTIHGGSGAAGKVLVGGQNFNNAINAMPSSAVRIGPGDNVKWGVDVSRLVTGYGELQFIYDPLLSAEYGMEGEMYIIDKSNVKQIQLNGMPYYVKRGVQAARDIHNIEDLYSGTRGLKMSRIELSRRVKNIG